MNTICHKDHQVVQTFSGPHNVIETQPCELNWSRSVLNHFFSSPDQPPLPRTHATSLKVGQLIADTTRWPAMSIDCQQAERRVPLDSAFSCDHGDVLHITLYVTNMNLLIVHTPPPSPGSQDLQRITGILLSYPKKVLDNRMISRYPREVRCHHLLGNLLGISESPLRFPIVEYNWHESHALLPLH